MNCCVLFKGLKAMMDLIMDTEMLVLCIIHKIFSIFVLVDLHWSVP